MKKEKPQTIKSLLKSFNSRKIKRAKKLKFVGVKGRDVYNITAPFKIKRTYYLLGRVEPREEETTTKIIFFRRPQHSRNWHVDKKCPLFDLQDPFISKFKDMIILGGIETRQRSAKKHLSYRTVFYRGKEINNLRRFAHSPWGMKGIRFIKLTNGRVLVFTRPQGKKGRRGKIGCIIIDSLSQLTSHTLSQAKLITGQFARGEWGGVNEVHLLNDGKLGILGHIARFSRDKQKYYYPITFYLDLEMGAVSKLKIIATRTCMPKGAAKSKDLYNVVYPGGLVRNGNGKAKLYVGVGDAEAYEITMEDPFLEYEQSDEEPEDHADIEKQISYYEQMLKQKIF